MLKPNRSDLNRIMTKRAVEAADQEFAALSAQVSQAEKAAESYVDLCQPLAIAQFSRRRDVRRALALLASAGIAARPITKYSHGGSNGVHYSLQIEIDLPTAEITIQPTPAMTVRVAEQQAKIRNLQQKRHAANRRRHEIECAGSQVVANAISQLLIDNDDTLRAVIDALSAKLQDIITRELESANA